MRKKYETLDQYLDDLDAIKERIAEKTKDMTRAQVIAYYADAAKRLEEKTGMKLKVRRVRQPRRRQNARKPATARS